MVENSLKGSARSAAPGDEVILPVAARWRLRWVALRLRRGPLREQVYRLARWLRYEILPRIGSSEVPPVVVELSAGGQVARMTHDGADVQVDGMPSDADLWRFMASLGVRRCRIDARLDRDQLFEAIVFLWAFRGLISERRAAGAARRALEALYTAGGVHVVCSELALCGEELAIRGSYCTTRFDHIVDWFERGPRTLRDHRTYFRAAPVYAATAVLLVTGPSLFYALIEGLWYAAVLLALASMVLFGLVYVAMMVIGRVEYDNEEKTEQLARAVADLQRYADRIGADLERARRVQERFLPAAGHMPHVPWLQWACRFEPAERVGGDYFDAAAIDPHRLVILFSDVCGHGMGAAFLTAVLKSTFLGWLDHHTGLDTLANELNSHLVRLAPEGGFAAVFLAQYDTRSGRLVYANCGHQPEPWLCPGDGERPVQSLSDARNLLLGIEAHLDLRVREVVLKPGDTVLFTSDGIVESVAAEDPYRSGSLPDVLDAHRGADPRVLVDAVFRWAEQAGSGGGPLDDRTVLAMRVHALAGTVTAAGSDQAGAYVI